MSKPQFPQLQVPIADKNGNITEQWRRLLSDLWTRTQAAQDSTSTLAQRLAQTEQDGMLLQPCPPPQ